MSGNGVAGIIAGGLRCITKGSLPNGMSKYFGGSADEPNLTPVVVVAAAAVLRDQTCKRRR
jgi:hypothetical protein